MTQPCLRTSPAGAILAACMTPQLLRLWQTRSARDLSYLFLILYLLGLALMTVYMYNEDATVGFICTCVELGGWGRGPAGGRQLPAHAPCRAAPAGWH